MREPVSKRNQSYCRSSKYIVFLYQADNFAPKQREMLSDQQDTFLPLKAKASSLPLWKQRRQCLDNKTQIISVKPLKDSGVQWKFPDNTGFKLFPGYTAQPNSNISRNQSGESKTALLRSINSVGRNNVCQKTGAVVGAIKCRSWRRELRRLPLVSKFGGLQPTPKYLVEQHFPTHNQSHVARSHLCSATLLVVLFKIESNLSIIHLHGL